jgi:uncharacterized repeat protein (TIGR02543 family)
MHDKRSIIFIIVIIFATFLLSIGYAQISDVNLNISGYALADKQTGIAISNVTYQTNNGANPSLSSINMYYQTTLDSHIVLGNDSSSTITYQISIINMTNEDYVYNGSTYDNNFYDNTNITYDVNGLIVGDPLLAGQTATFNITFHYDGTDTSNTTLNSYINFRFKKANSATIHFVSNGGETYDDMDVVIGDPLGALPTPPNKETCSLSEPGTPKERGCTYIGEFVGWYADQSFNTLVDSSYIVNGDMNLYAKWNSIYEYFPHIPLISFNGVDEYLDSGIKLYSEDNINKDFEIVFDLYSFDTSHIMNSGLEQTTIMNSKDESQNTYPGFVVRFNTRETASVFLNYRWGGTNNKKSTSLSNLPIHFEIKRVNGIVSTSITGSSPEHNNVTLYNQANWTMPKYYNKGVVFGCSYNSSGEPFRFFKGSLANIEITLHQN